MFEFWKSTFKDDTQGASTGANAGQVFSFIALIAAIAWVTYIVWHTHTYPDPVTMTGLTGWSTAHYLVHRGASAKTPTAS